VEREFGAHLCFGPPLENGFFYDSYVGDVVFSDDNFKAIEKHAKDIAKANMNFVRVVLTKKEALDVFKHNPFKISLITNKVKEEGKCSLYIMGDFVDLCTGPHIPNTALVKAF